MKSRANRFHIANYALLSLFGCLSLPSAFATTEDAEDLQAIFANAFGNQQTLPAQLKLNLAVSNTEFGELLAHTDGKHITHVKTDPFLEYLKFALKSEHYLQIKTEAFHTPHKFPLEKLTQWGITYQHDINSLQLDLTIPTELRIPTPIHLKHKRRALFKADELSKPETFSGYTNVKTRLEHDHNSNRTRQRVEIESVANIDQLVLENQLTWRNAQTTLTEAKTSRDYTKLSVDDKENMHRYSMGDISTVGINLQNGIQLGGVSLRKYSGMNPYRHTNTGTAQTFTLEERSQVSIFVNDALQAARHLDEGFYSLNDLNLSPGINTVRLEITNTDGDVREENFTLTHDYQLLNTEEAEYGLDIGAPRYRDDHATHYDASTLIASGYYQQGISQSMTAGVSGITDGDNTQAGVNLSAATSVGKFNSVLSASQSEGDMGYGSKLEYRYLASHSDMPNLFLSAEHYDEHFASLHYDATKHELAKSTHATKNRLYASIGKKLNDKAHVTLTGQYETQYSHDDAKKSANLNVRHQLAKGKSISGQIRYQSQADEKDVSGQLNLHLPLARNEFGERYKTFDVRYNSLDESIISRLSISPDNNMGAESLAGSVTHQKRANAQSVSGNLSYRSKYLETALSHQASRIDGYEDRHTTRLKLNTAVAFAGKNLAISPPIRDSFAIVKAPKNQSTSAKPIAVNKGQASFIREKGGELPDNYQNLIGKNGSAAVIELTDYHQTTINVDSTALPIGSDPDETEFKLQPGYHQGYVLTAGGLAGVILDGSLVDEQGHTLGLKGGQLQPSDSDNPSNKAIPFFTNQTGRFRLPSVPPGRYKLELFDYDAPVLPVIHVPNKVGEIVDLKAIQFPTQ
jgi:outer membrane usher protein